MDAHGGSISVYSEGEGTGSIFTVELMVPAESSSKATPGFMIERLVNQGSVSVSCWPPMYPSWKMLSFASALWNTCLHRSSVHDADTIIVKNGNMDKDQKKILQIVEDNSLKIKIIRDEEERVERKRDELIYPQVSLVQCRHQASSHVLKLLIADDSDVCRNMLARALVSRFRVCNQAEDGRQALEMMKASIEADDPYDVVLMDLQMPLVNGSEAAKHMREALGYGGVIIGLTGNALPEDLDAFKSAGADDVLVKPIKVNQFDDALRRMVKKSAKKDL